MTKEQIIAKIEQIEWDLGFADSEKSERLYERLLKLQDQLEKATS